MGDEPIALQLGRFARGLTLTDVPGSVADHARWTMLDAFGVALAASRAPWVDQVARAVERLSGPGHHAVINRPERLAARDAALINGALVHGLDYDDTHPAGIIHASASALPGALVAAARTDGDGGDLLLGYLLSVEVTCRLGAVAGSAFHTRGFHPSALLGAYGSVVGVGRIAGLSAERIAGAQGIVGSFAAGTMAFLDGGAWTKRLQPGWGAVAGLTAVALAEEDFVAPRSAYEGRYGLYQLFLGDDAPAEPGVVLRGLGTTWDASVLEVKPFPACVFIHPYIEAALDAREGGIAADEIDALEVDLPWDAMAIVAEPSAEKSRPTTAYQAQFSLPFAVAATLIHGRFSLRELDDECLGDPAVVALASRVSVRPDASRSMARPHEACLGVRTRGGVIRRFSRRAAATDGLLDRELTERKFLENADVGGHRRAPELRDAVLALGNGGSVDALLKEIAL